MLANLCINDLKKIISQMDQNEVQTLLRDLLVKNADVSDSAVYNIKLGRYGG